MNKKVAIVTGANRGIGLEVARQLAQAGIQTILTARDSEKGNAAVKQLAGEGLDVTFCQCDVTSAASIHALAIFVEKEFGRCDILVNNAGVFPDTVEQGTFEFKSILDSDIDTIRRGMETNVYGPILLAQEIVPLMKKNNYGRIVNVSSGMGALSEMDAGFPSYRISKTAINAVTRILSKELQDTNIKVNSVCPGWVRTDMGGPNANRELPEGAETIIWLSTLDDNGPTGGFFRDKELKAW